uniref:Ribonuclease E n=1 Tax=Hommersandiophycus borowitzkae TaxID=268573 RepID=A0A1G4NTY7_9FLOR|nr:Ribonuclease E [Hommersandiophycus borowitzkae]SCW22074.1 Ribonuclease E [Hommersandiophycus borowitzkae]
MIKKIIISHLNNIAAIIHNSKIQELIVNNDIYQLNDIYIGIVQKIFTSINAAFIKLNYSNKSGFIHVSDTKYLYRLKHSNLSSISEALSIRQKILVQIIKEPTLTKGPRLTTNIHLSGQYVILMPLNNTICIGQSIYDENERSFLRALGILVKPFRMGILFKESAVGIAEKTLIHDIQHLNRKWNFIEKSAIEASYPQLIYYDTDIIQKVLRNHFDKKTTIIIADSKNSLQQIHEYLITHKLQSYKQKIYLQLYQTNTCILEKFCITSVIFNMLNPKIELPSGIYMFIESSEALTTIDVNSGSFNQYGNTNTSLLQTNCLAATEIGYQLKIRNINGIIIIDFIDMKSNQDQLVLLKHLDQVLSYDDAKPEIIQLSELGLVELTRRRRGQSIKEIFGYNEENNVNKKKIKEQEKNLCISTNQSSYNEISDINSTFFKKTFTYHHKVKDQNTNANRFLELKYKYMIPMSLYYSIIENTIHYN